MCKREARPRWPHVFTTQQAYLEHHVTLLLAKLIHRTHNRNAIRRSPSGMPGCTMRGEPRNRFLVPARPNRLCHLTLLLLTWRALCAAAAPLQPCQRQLCNNASARLLWKLSPGSGDTGHMAVAGLGKENAKPHSLGTETAGRYSDNIHYSGE